MYHTIEEHCIGCSACKKVCPTEAISGVKKEIHVIEGKLCINCSSCGRVCPKSAVKGHLGQNIEKLKRAQWLKPLIIICQMLCLRKLCRRLSRSCSFHGR